VTVHRRMQSDFVHLYRRPRARTGGGDTIRIQTQVSVGQQERAPSIHASRYLSSQTWRTISDFVRNSARSDSPMNPIRSSVRFCRTVCTISAEARGLACATAMVGRAARGDRDQVRPLTSEDEDLLPIEPRRGRVSEPIRPRGPCPLSSKPASSIESSRRRASSSQKLRMHQIQHCMSDCTSRRQQVVAAVCSAIAGGRPA